MGKDSYFTSFTPSSSEADDLTQYLDHLLAHAAPKKPQVQAEAGAGGGLSRFKAIATKTKEMASLMSKAQELNVHSEWIGERWRTRVGPPT